MKNRSIDPWLILTAALLVVFGLVMVYSASAMKAFERSGEETYYLTRQLVAVAVGLILAITTAVTPMRIMRRYRVMLYSAVLGGLILCFVPGIRHGANGAYRWIGFGPIHWQPSEFAKIIVLIMMADYLDKFRRQIGDVKVVLGAMLVPLPALLLILPQPDFGTTAIIAGLCGIMVFTAGLQIKHTIVAGVAAIIVGIPVMIFEPYRVKRLTSFLDPWQSMEAEGYHIIQSWVAMHSGGFWGQGLGNSVSKLDFLPEPWTDFIGAVIAEELGLVAMIGLIGLYAIFLWRGLHIARHARDAFSMLLASTLTLMVGLEAFFNLGVVMGMLPPKGLVLPFISYGATAMMSHLWVVGILLSISAESHKAPVSAGWPLATDDKPSLKGAA
jgi:cell division protein FtsW